MEAPRLEVADVFRLQGPEYLKVRGDSMSSAQKRVFRAIQVCRTAALGGHVEQCDRCGHRRNAYNSCRNRHCPKCQALARGEWLQARAKDLLPVEYFHVVFTIPQQIRPVALQNKRTVYAILFEAASETLRDIARDPKHLGAQIGFLAVLHTWGQNLLDHPHLHCVIPGGGLSDDGSRWVACPKSFFLPIRVLSRVFRGKFLEALRSAFDRGGLSFHGELKNLSDRVAFARFVRMLRRTEWVVYSKPPFGGPTQVLKYLARYTHRVAISNARLVSLEDGKVTFRWKDYADRSRQKTMTLDADEFIRRFLLHVLPKGFMRIRHYGLLSNRQRQQKIALCRRLLGEERPDEDGCTQMSVTDFDPAQGRDRSERCPVCNEGHMVRIDRVAPQPLNALALARVPPMDSS